MSWTSTDLLNSIKKRGLIPTSQATFQDTDFLRFANEELQMTIVPLLMSVREEYMVEKVDFSLIASQPNYTIPTRAIGRKLREVIFVDSSGFLRAVPRMDPEEYPLLGYQIDTGDPQFYYLQADDLYTVPSPSLNPNGTLRMFYFQRPNDIVPVANTMQITAINTGTHTVTVSSASVAATYSVGTLCDLINGNPGFRNKAIDQAITAISSSDYTFASLPSNLAVGDYIALAGQTPIPQIPTELHPVLAQRVVVKALEALNDGQGAQIAQAKLQEMEQKVLQLLSNRVEGSPRKITNHAAILSYFSRGF